MSSQIVMEAAVRTEFGKGASRKLRRSGNVPAVLYGHHQEVKHLAVDTHEVFMAIKGQSNVIVTLKVEGESHLALIKEVQVEPVKRTIEHVDFVLVSKGEKINVEVPVALTGEVKGQAVATVDMINLRILAPSTDIPEHILVDVEGLVDGDMIRVKDLKLPAGVECEEDPEEPVVSVAVPELDAALAAEEAAAAEAAEAETK